MPSNWQAFSLPTLAGIPILANVYTSPLKNCNRIAPVKVLGIKQHALKGVCIIYAAL